MKNFLIFILLLIGVSSSAQYIPINSRYQWYAGAFDSTIHIPIGGATPSLRTKGHARSGALFLDSINHRPHIYSQGTWYRLAKYTELSTGSRFGVEDAMAGQNRTFTGLNNTYSLTLDSLNSFAVRRNNIDRLLINSSNSYLLSPNGLSQFWVANGIVSMNAISGANYLNLNSDSGFTPKRISYLGNIHSTFFPYSLVDKSYVDSVAGLGSGSGTVNTGAANKAAYYPSAGTTVDDWAGVDFGTTNLNTKITTQATTEVGLEIKGQSSQTANLLNISSSAGTGDLASVTADGYGQFKKIGIGTAPTEFLDVLVASGNTVAQFKNSTGRADFILDGASGQSARTIYHIAGVQKYVLGVFDRSGGSNLDYETYNNQTGAFPLFIDGNTDNIGVGNNTTPTAKLHITGSASGAANTASLKINSGTLLGTTEAGVLENNGTHLYYTATNGGTRFQLDHGATEGSVLFAGASGAIAEDNSNFFFDNTNNRLGIGINTGFNSTRLEIVDNSLGNANGVRIASSSTTAAGSGQRLLAVTLSGANATSSQTTYAGWLNNSHTGTGAINHAVYGQASGGNQNYGVSGIASGNSITDNFGVSGTANGNTSTNNYGVYGTASGTSTNNYGASFGASGGTNNYGIVVPGGQGNVGFGTITPNAAALLDLTSTSQGLLIPRMTKTQRDAISSPVAGLMVYQTDNTPGLRVYNGTNWMRFTETAD